MDKLNELYYSGAPLPMGVKRAGQPGQGSFNPRKVQVDMLKADYATLAKNPQALGLSDAEKQQQIDQAAQAAGAQRQSAQAELGRQALAGQGFQQGAFTQASQNIGAGAAQDVAQASAQVQDRSNQLIEQEKDRILAEVDAERAKRTQNRQFWLQFGLSSYEAVGKNIGQALQGLL